MIVVIVLLPRSSSTAQRLTDFINGSEEVKVSELCTGHLLAVAVLDDMIGSCAKRRITF